MDGKPVVHQDAQFDICSILLEVAIWLTKYGSRVAAKSEITEEDAKIVLKSFKQAAGVFELVKTESEKLLDKSVPGGDMDSHIIECYQLQCRAEAQEVTIARAVTLKHKPQLIAALAKDTKDFFEQADKQLAAIKNDEIVGKWRKVRQKLKIREPVNCEKLDVPEPAKLKKNVETLGVGKSKCWLEKRNFGYKILKNGDFDQK